MRQVILSVYDVQVGAYMRPMFVPAVGAGVRAFTDEVNRVGSEMNMHPADYQLFALGTFDDASGMVECEDKPALIVSGASVLKQGQL